MSLKRKVIASYLGSGWSALIGLAIVPLYVRYLGIESYGLIGFFATLQVWLSVLDMGFAATLNREMARFSAGSHGVQVIRDLLKSMEVIYGAIACGIAVLVGALSPMIAVHWLNAKVLQSQTVAQVIALMGAVIALQWMGTLYRSGLLGLQRQVWLGSAVAIVATARALGTVVVLAFVSPTIVAFFLFQAIVSAVETLVLGRHLRGCLPQSHSAARCSIAALKHVWRFAGSLTIISLLATLLTQFDKVLLAKLLPLDQFGYFMLMAAIAGAISVLIVPLHNVAYPRFAELVASGDQITVTAVYHDFAQLLSIGVIPFALMLAFFPREILFLWTGDATITDAIAPLLTVWVLGTTLNSLTHVPHMAQVAHGRTKLAITVNALAVAVTLPSLLLLVPRHGAMAAAWIWVAVNAAYILFAIPVMHSQILRGEKWKWYAQDVLIPLIAGMVGAVAWKGLSSDSRGLTPTAHLVVGGLFIALIVAMATKLGRQTSISLMKSAFRE